MGAETLRTELGLLGDVHVRFDGRAVDLGPARQRCVLGVLLTEVNQPIPPEKLVDRLWGERPPSRAVATLRSYLSRLRTALADVDGCVLDRGSGGYLVRADPLTVDLHRFRHLTAQARRTTDDAEAADAYARALSLWRGEPLAALDTPWAAELRTTLQTERFAARLDHHEVRLRRGEHAALLPELQAAASAHPLDERLAGQLLLALYRSGRQAAALEHYEQLRRRLAEELGASPGPSLQRLHQQILTADTALQSPPAPAPRPRRHTHATVAVPRQLPADVPGFTGRAAQLRRLDALLAEASTDAAASSLVLAVVGTAGVGKTALAVHWAHRVRDRFPDGQLYVDLRGYTPGSTPMSPHQALARFLRALGTDHDQVPEDTEEAAAAFRSLVAGKRLLILLDNACASDQVRDLLPAEPGCAVVITSRDRLTGLSVRHGAHRLALDVLPKQDAQALLGRDLGDERFRDRPEVAELAALCGHLPLALRIATARLGDTPHGDLGALLAELRSSRLAALEVEGDEHSVVRTAFDLSYQALDAPVRRCFRLLGLFPGPDFPPEAAAALADVPVTRAQRMLERLAAAHLVRQPAPGRYTFHDLTRLYAVERATGEESEEARQAAKERLWHWYLRRVHDAWGHISPDWLLSPHAVPEPREGPQPPRFADEGEAARWLEMESGNLLTLVEYGANHGLERASWRLSEMLRGYLWQKKPLDDWLAIARHSVRAADADGDLAARAAARLHLLHVHTHRADHEAAVALCGEARRLAEQAGWLAGEAAVLRSLAQVHWRSGRLRQAADCLSHGLELARRDREHSSLVAGLSNLSLVHQHLGDLRSALACLTEAATLADNTYREAAVLQELAAVRHGLGQMREALEDVARALRLSRTVRDRGTEGDCLRVMAELHRDLGQRPAAVAAATEGLAVLEDMGDALPLSQVLNVLGTVHTRFGEPGLAEGYHRRALQAAESCGHVRERVNATLGLARAASLTGRREEALAQAEQAAAEAGTHGYRDLEGYALTAAARARLALGQAARAAEDAGRAVAIQRETGHRLGLARAHQARGLALREVAGEEAARAELAAAEKVFTELGAPEVAEVWRALAGEHGTSVASKA